MTLIPAHSFGIQNAWWFSALYGIINLIVLITLPKEQRKKILTFPKFNSKFEKISSGLSLFIFGRGLIIYSIFIPIKLWTINFFIGTIIYLIGLCLAVTAIFFFAKAELSKPVTNGIYKITRHPMQVMSFIMWFGISIATGSLILIICTFLLGMISYPSLKAQEKFCIEKYGNEYKEYMKKTPRYLIF